jgi:Uma2 family endonuclease
MRSEFEEGFLYELARGVIVVTEVPGLPHGLIVERLCELFVGYKAAHPGRIAFRASGANCCLRLPGMQSDRHPDQAIYLSPPPDEEDPWTEWVPELVVEVVSRGGEHRDYEEKREEYLRAGVQEYWILDPRTRRFLALRRLGDTWEQTDVPENGTYRTRLLPGLVVRPSKLFGPRRGRRRRRTP